MRRRIWLIIIYFITIFILQEKCENMVGSTKSQTNVSVYSALDRNIRAMNRLAAHLITFTVSKSPLLVCHALQFEEILLLFVQAVSIVALINLSELRILGLGHKTPCKTYEKGRLFFQVELLASLAAIIWLLGMTDNAQSEKSNNIRVIYYPHHNLRL